MKENFSLGDRMKSFYENISRQYLTRRMPVILRLDGKAFHTFTRGFEKPYSRDLIDLMNYTALEVVKEIQGAKCAYVQSDEISILVTDYETLDTEAWFDYNVQKMVSIASAKASVAFSKAYLKLLMKNGGDVDALGSNAYFDCRAFNLPREEVNNYFVWRQKDWERNSIQMLARSLYSQKALDGKKIPDMHELIFAKGLNWAKQPDDIRNGRFIERVDSGWKVSDECGIFAKDHVRIEGYVYPVVQ